MVGWKRRQVRHSRSKPDAPGGRTAARRVVGCASSGPPHWGQPGFSPLRSRARMAFRSRGLNRRHVRERIPDRMPEPPAEECRAHGDGVQGAFPSAVVPARLERRRSLASGPKPTPQLGLGHGAQGALRGRPGLPAHFRKRAHRIRFTLRVEDEVPPPVVPGRLFLQGRGDPHPPVLVLEAPHTIDTFSDSSIESIGRWRRGRATVCVGNRSCATRGLPAA